jgi:hypothetical protein
VKSRAAGFVPALLLLAGCAGPRLLDAEDPALAEFPAELRGAVGFDELAPEAGNSMGDRLLASIELQGEEGVRRWYVSLTDLGVRGTGVSGSSSSFTINIKGKTHRLSGRERNLMVTVQEVGQEAVKTTMVALPEEILRNGLHGAGVAMAAILESGVELKEDMPEDALNEVPDEIVRSYVLGWGSAMMMLLIMQENDQLAPILWSVIDRPNPLSILLDGGVKLLLRAGEVRAGDSAPLPPPLDAFPCQIAESTIHVNGKHILDCTFDAVPAVSPFLPSAGIVRVVGTHPSREWPRLVVQVLGARRLDPDVSR